MASKGISQRSMAKALGCSRHHIAKVLKNAEIEGLNWLLPDEVTDNILRQRLLLPSKVASDHVIPDYALINKEMKKSSVTLTLLWAEYCERCRTEGKRSFMYTQFCHHYRN